MSRFAERLRRDLDQIADRATPSSTAWDAIQNRIDEQPDEPDMEVIMLTPEDKKSPKRTQIAVGSAAAAILIVVGIVALISNDDEPDVDVITSTTTTQVSPDTVVDAGAAVDIARNFVLARDTWDGEAARALVADDAAIDDHSTSTPTQSEGHFVGTADDYLTDQEFLRVTGWRFMDPQCEAIAAGPPAEVTCTYTVQNAWSEALSVGPLDGNSFEFVIEDDLIHELTHDFETQPFETQVWKPFAVWMGASYPDDANIMYGADFSVAQKTLEAIALWDQYTAEFVPVATALRYMDARDGWDGEAALALLADDVVIDAVVAPDDYVANAAFEEATNWRFLSSMCTATVVGPPAEVTCSYSMRNAWSVAQVGLGQFSGSSFTFVIDDGLIQELTHDFDTTEFAPQVSTVFLTWVLDNHPDDFETMYEDGSKVNLTPEAIALFEQRTEEFAASVNDS